MVLILVLILVLTLALALALTLVLALALVLVLVLNQTLTLTMALALAMTLPLALQVPVLVEHPGQGPEHARPRPARRAPRGFPGARQVAHALRRGSGRPRAVPPSGQALPRRGEAFCTTTGCRTRQTDRDHDRG